MQSLSSQKILCGSKQDVLVARAEADVQTVVIQSCSALMEGRYSFVPRWVSFFSVDTR